MVQEVDYSHANDRLALGHEMVGDGCCKVGFPSARSANEKETIMVRGWLCWSREVYIEAISVVPADIISFRVFVGNHKRIESALSVAHPHSRVTDKAFLSFGKLTSFLTSSFIFFFCLEGCFSCCIGGYGRGAVALLRGYPLDDIP